MPENLEPENLGGKYTKDEAQRAIAKALRVLLPEEKQEEGKYTRAEAREAMTRALKILRAAPETVKDYEKELKEVFGEEVVEELKAEQTAEAKSTEPEKPIDVLPEKPRRRRISQVPPTTE